MGRLKAIAMGVLVYTLAALVQMIHFFRKRDPREYGLTAADRQHELRRKFGDANLSSATAALGSVQDPTDKVLGAIVFLAVDLNQLPDLVKLANTDQERLLRAATVKDERG